MSVLGAFNTAISGMTAQSNALSSISQNISNSSTVGYQAVQTNFEDMVLTGSGSATGNIANSLGGVKTSNYINTQSGQITSTGVSTDIAIDGNGFMVVNTKSDASTGTYLATLAGSFRPDANGNLVNAAGYYLQGVQTNADGTPVDNNQGNTLNSLSTVNINSVQSAAAATKTVTFAANLPSSQTAYSTATPTVSSNTISYYDALGSAHTLTMNFTPVPQTTAGSAQTNTWTLSIVDNSTGTPTEVANATLSFNGSGTAAGTLQSVSNVGTGAGGSSVTWDGTDGELQLVNASGQAINVNLGTATNDSGSTTGDTSGMTQYDGDFQTTALTQDGSSYGTLSSVSVTKDGMVEASFSNGTTRPIYQLKLATVANAQGLTQVSGDAFAFSPAAGNPVLSNPGSGSAGSTDGGSLEGSNVDITTELTNLIETQRAYSSNATVIQTGNSMLQTADQLHNAA